MKKYFSLFLAVIMLVAAFSSIEIVWPEEAYAADHVMSQIVVDKPNTPSENNAYIIFSDTPKMNKMRFEDGVGTDRYTNDTFNERVYFGDVEGRQVWKENYLCMSLEPGFASPEDSLFKIEIDYWDYSGIGWFFIDYTTVDPKTTGRVSVLKEGDPNGDPKWHRLTVYITDASFSQSMPPYGSDLKIVTNAFNAFSKIEITNLSAGGQESVEELGTFNTMQEDALKHFGLYTGLDGAKEYTAGLDKFMTRQEFIKDMYYAADFDEEVLEANLSPKAKGADALYAPFVAYAEKEGIIAESENFDPKANLTQQEMLLYYSRFLGLEGDFVNDAYNAGCSSGLLQRNEAVFQMKKNITRDNFVGVAVNALIVPYKGGKAIMEGLMDEKKVTGHMIYNAGYGKLFDWMITKSFYLGHRTVVDPQTGRSYNAIDFFGEAAIKNYFTMPMTSADDTRFYFRDRYFRMYEYNMVTGMCTYIDTGIWNWEHAFACDAMNRFYYVNQKYEIVRMDCDDHSKKEVVSVFPKEQQVTTSLGVMLQPTYDGSAISIAAPKTPPGLEELGRRYGIFPIIDTKTGEWDFSTYYGNFFQAADGYVNANHNCVSPTDSNLMFFAHEGAPVWDRVWCVDIKNQKYWNVNKTRLMSDNDMGLNSGVHEFWCHQGCHIGWISSSGNWISRKTPTCEGVMSGYALANYDGTDINFVNNEYSYNHPSISPDHRFGVADVQLRVGYPVGVYLIDILTGKSEMMAAPPCVDNPGHSHPQFSWNSKIIFFGLGDDNFQYANVGWMDVSDIQEKWKNTPGGEYNLSDTCETFGYDGFEHYIQPMEDKDGNSYFHIEKGNKMNVRIKPDVTECFNTKLKITVTYRDASRSPVNIDYKRYVREGQTGREENCSVSIARKDTGKWITKEIILEDMDAGNPYLLKTDFKLYGVLSPADIKNVEVEVLYEDENEYLFDSGGNGGYIAEPHKPRYPR